MAASAESFPRNAQDAGVLTDKFQRWMVAVAVLASAMMELVDTSAVNVSLPYIAGNLSASVNEATWVLTSYLVASAVILPLSGWLVAIPFIWIMRKPHFKEPGASG